MKRFITGFLVGAIICSLLGVYAVGSIYDNPFKIFVNGEEKEIKGYNIDDYSYFKLRDIANAVGGFSVDFVDETIQIQAKSNPSDVAVGEEIKVPAPMKEYFADLGYHISDFSGNEVETSKYASDFVWWFYNGKDVIARQEEINDDGYPVVPWDAEIVKNQYKLLFGKDMPEGPIDESSMFVENDMLTYNDGVYRVASLNLGDIGYDFYKAIKTENGYKVVLNEMSADGREQWGTKTFILENSDNENGFIITSVVSEDIN